MKEFEKLIVDLKSRPDLLCHQAAKAIERLQNSNDFFFEENTSLFEQSMENHRKYQSKILELSSAINEILKAFDNVTMDENSNQSIALRSAAAIKDIKDE